MTEPSAGQRQAMSPLEAVGGAGGTTAGGGAFGGPTRDGVPAFADGGAAATAAGGFAAGGEGGGAGGGAFATVRERAGASRSSRPG
jgi:hypothetical protein